MTEPLDEFERELTELKPARWLARVTDSIANQLGRPAALGLADRVIAMFMGSGALAAMVIVGLLTLQGVEDRSPAAGRAMPVVARGEPASVGMLQAALARS